MSTVKTDAIETAAGGTSVLTLGTSTQTLKILGGTPGATKVLTSDATGGATWGVAAVSGFSRVDTWVMDTNYVADTTPTLLSNWTHSSDSGYNAYSLGNIGAAFAAPSTGVFTFPETGIWQVQSTVEFYTWGGYYNQARFETHVTDDNGVGWERMGMHVPYIPNTVNGAGYGASAPIDITDLSNDKVKFLASEVTTAGAAAMQIEGSATLLKTWVTFVKLGET